MEVCLGTGGMSSKSMYLCVRERGEKREREGQKVSQALRYFLKLGHSSVDTMLDNTTKEDPLDPPLEHAGSS